jgi:hypothetical protein
VSIIDGCGPGRSHADPGDWRCKAAHYLIMTTVLVAFDLHGQRSSAARRGSNVSRGQVGLAWKYAPGVVLVSRRNAATNALVVW